MKHKVFAIFLIALILLLYISATVVFKDQNIQWNTVNGVIDGSGLYLSWLGSIFTNMKTITSYAVAMDWRSNETVDSEKNEEGLFKLKTEKEKS